MAEQLADPRRYAIAPRAEGDDQHQKDLQRRRDHRGEEHQAGHHLAPVAPELLGAAEHGRERLAPDHGEAEHGSGVGNRVEDRRRQGQRQGAIERVLAGAVQLVVTARAARRRSGPQRGKPLHQVAMRAGDERRVADRLIVVRRPSPSPRVHAAL